MGQRKYFYENLSMHYESSALVLEDGTKIAYQDLSKSVEIFSGYFNEKSLVFCLCGNNEGSIIGYLGCLSSKLVPFMINENIRQELYLKLLETYRPRFIWVNKNRIDKKLNFKEKVSIKDFVLLETDFEIDYKINEKLALLLTTSGSTGSPKLVRLSYDNIQSNAESIAEYLKISKSDKPITTLPISYTFGLSIINSHLLTGSTIILTSQTFFDKSFWDLLRNEQATTFSGVPYQYEILSKLRFSKMNLPSITKLTQAGGKLSIALSKTFAELCNEKKIEFYIMYGQTEATARMSFLSPELTLSKLGSIGKPIPGGEFVLVNSDNKIVTNSDKEGELIYKGPNVFLGYANSRFDLEKDDENNGILHTGDIAKRDIDGYYYIVGRKSRFIKLFGNRVNLEEVEQILLSGKFNCVCAGQDNILKVYTTNQKEIPAIEQYIIENTDINPSGFQIMFISEIPRNEYGRVQYSILN